MFEGMNMNMNGLGDKMMNRFFRRVDNAVWDMFTGRIGVETSEGITTLEGEGDDAQINVNIMENFGMPVPAFAQSTQLADVAVGDLIYVGNKPKGWVIEVKLTPATESTPEKRKFKIMTPTGTETNWTPPKVSMLGFDSGVMVLRSLMNMLPSGETGLNSMQGMLMPMMMMGGDVDFEKIMPMMLFSQLGADGKGTDTAMGNNMMQMMMMAQMMGGGSKKPKRGGGGYFDS